MQPIVSVIAPGMMGSAVGACLTKNGIEVRTSLANRSEATVARAKTAGMVGVSDEQVARGVEGHCVGRRLKGCIRKDTDDAHGH